MAISKAQQKATQRYIKEKIDEIKVRTPKGKKDVIKAHADAVGQSVNAYIIQAVDDRIQRETESD